MYRAALKVPVESGYGGMGREREEGIEERERKGERSSQSWIDVATDTTQISRIISAKHAYYLVGLMVQSTREERK